MLQRVTQSVLENTAAAIDRAATLAASVQSSRARRRNQSESLAHHERLTALEELAQLYESEPSNFFREPRKILPSERYIRELPEGRVVDLAWASNYEPFVSEVADRYQRVAENHIAAARLFTSRQPRPLVVLVHGYMTGNFAIEQRAWPVEWFYRIGLDVALFVLPFHGVRAARDRTGPPPFPSSDPRITNEGFRQAMSDLRDLIECLLDRGHPSVGIMGMSLGGYTTALAATLEPRLSFAVPIIPLASVADFARDHGRLGKTPRQTADQHAALDRVHHIVSPLHRKPLIAQDKIFIVGARADRITPISHAQRLARHFRAPLETWPGGHLLQYGRSDQFRRIGRLISEMGVIEPRPT